MTNPINQLIGDELFQTLLAHNLLNTKMLRDIEIKRAYLRLHRDGGMASVDAIEHILESFPYLQFDTVRKIVYSVRLPEEGRNRQRQAA
jgi:hypothetical protein